MEPGRYALLEAVGVGYGVDVLEGNATNAGIAGNLIVQRILLRFLLLERDGKAAGDHAWAVLVDHGAGDAIGSCGIQLGTFSPVGDALSLENLFQVFKDGEVTSYAADGSKIRGGAYEIKVYEDGRNGGWELGKLTTSEPALLFPWSINEGGVPVTEFDIMYMDGDYMNLVYTKGNGAGSWGEITFWRFKGE